MLDRVPIEGHVVIEASAGTGKTHTLEHLVVDLILRGEVQIDQVLIVTFTEPATAELKSRVRSKLEDLVRLDAHRCEEEEPHWQVGPKERALVQAQLDLFGRASIHTIHGFCHRILIENAFHLGRLFDEEHTDSATIFDMAFKRALRSDLALDPDLQRYLLVWLEEQDLGSLRDSLAFLSREDARLEPRFAEEGLRKALDNLATLGVEERRSLARSFEGALSRVVEPYVTDKLMRLVDDLLAAVPAYADSGDIAALLAATDEQLRYCLEGTRRTDNIFRTFHEVEVPPGSAQVSLRGALVRLIPLRSAVLHKLLPPVRQALAAIKAHGWFDYDDMLTGVWNRMADPDDHNGRVLVEFLRRRYKFALIDEFQDTDPVQWNIFRRVFFDSDPRQNRLFVIGDPKQAIYGFRGADVHTYLEAKNAILARGAPQPPEGGALESAEPEPVRLAENFRSTDALIAAYNEIFDQRAGSPFFDGPIRYDAPVTCGNPGIVVRDAQGRDLAPITLVRAVPRQDKLDAYSLKRTLGKWIAREIRRILDEGVNIHDETSGETRTVGPEDIYVLARSGSEARRIGQYLREVHVPYAFYKEEGLFQTGEARHVLELLVAISDPYSKSNRLKAWSTPFFGVPFEDLARCGDLVDTHPLMAALLDWHEYASRGEFERLFGDVLDRSGVVRREIFRGPSERELTNYMHIFEILLEEVHSARASLADLIVRLRALIDQARYRGADDRNIQRLETDKAAVQIMTIHKSKGLEADVVFVYGGLSRGPQTDSFRVCHEDGDRVVYMGLPQSSRAMKAVAKETREEDQRLLYVAITRARALLYLPFVAVVDGELQFAYLDGTYKVLNDRLLQIADDPQPLFSVVEANVDDFRVREGGLEMPRAATYSDWRLPPPVDDGNLERVVRPLMRRPLVVSSYSRMKRTSEYLDTAAREDFMLEVTARALDWGMKDELPPGTDTGIFLHDILERVEFAPLRGEDSFERWIARPEIDRLFRESMTSHGIEDRYADYSRKLVWATLTSPLELPGCRPMDRLAEASRDLREVEFLFPIPEASNPPVNTTPPPDVLFDVQRGYIKGFIDLVFEHDGKVFFADWKSDSLERYDQAELSGHVTAHYETQAWLYSIAVLKMFGIHEPQDFDSRFGGFMYAFVRGIDGTPGRGFYVHRPDFEQIRAYEQKLETTEFR